MKIETKYNLGDKFYRITDNKPTEVRISSIYVAAGDNAVRVTYTLVGGGYRYSDITDQKLENEYYRSKSALMLAMFPDLFKEVKNVWVLNGEGGEE